MIIPTLPQYHPQHIEAFAGNPLIEAFELLPDMKELIRRLSHREKYDPVERTYTVTERLGMTGNILKVHQPSVIDVHMAHSLQNTILWGYVGRNPLNPNTVVAGNEMVPEFHSGKDPALRRQFQSKIHGFSVIGASGIGKTTTMENILSWIPQVIIHREYKGIRLNCRQVSWLKIDFPGDGSMKQLCKLFFHSMDDILGTAYADKYRRCTLDEMLVGINRVSFAENLGVLVIDEVQHLVSAGSRVSEQALNFIVSLVNTTGVPVVFIGTPKARSLFQQDFQQARRASAQGDFTWKSFDEGEDWERYLKSLWMYQYTKEPVALTSELSKAFFRESFGNQALTAILYKLVQEDAILYSRESFTVEDVHKVASRNLKLTEAMRRGLRNKQDVDMDGLIAEARERSAAFANQRAAEEAAETLKESNLDQGTSKQTMIQEVASSLTLFGVSYQTALRCVEAVSLDKDGPMSKTVLARKAYEMWLVERKKEEDASAPTLQEHIGYESLDKAGFIESEEVA